MLEIAIPTFNRKVELIGNLEVLRSEFERLSPDLRKDIKITIYDNASDYDVGFVIRDYIQLLPITLKSSEYNLGPTLNFEKCFREVSSKYLWILADDDYLNEGKLFEIISALKSNLGDIYFLPFSLQTKEAVINIHHNNIQMLSYYPTMISSIIFPSDYLKNISPNFLNTNLHHLYYFYSCLEGNIKLYCFKNIMVHPAYDNNSGGYNWFKVFCDDFTSIITYSGCGISFTDIKKIKRKILINMIIPIFIRYKENIIVSDKFINEDLSLSYKRIVACYGDTFFNKMLIMLASYTPITLIRLVLKMMRFFR